MTDVLPSGDQPLDGSTKYKIWISRHISSELCLRFQKSGDQVVACIITLSVTSQHITTFRLRRRSFRRRRFRIYQSKSSADSKECLHRPTQQFKGEVGCTSQLRIHALDHVIGIIRLLLLNMWLPLDLGNDLSPTILILVIVLVSLNRFQVYYITL